MADWTLNGLEMDQYLALNGVTLEAPELVGGERLALLGGCRKDVAARKRVWSARTVPVLADIAPVLRCMLQGEVDVWSFDEELVSAQGVVPSVVFGPCTVVSGGAYGSSRVLINGGRLEYPVPGSPTEWSLMFWRWTTLHEETDHFLMLGSGEKYLDGEPTSDDTWASYDGETLKLQAPGDFYPAWESTHIYAGGARINGAGFVFSVSEGGGNASGSSEPDFGSVAVGDYIADESLVWQNLGEAKAWFDHVVLWPCIIPEEWRGPLFALQVASAWSAPQLQLAGDLVSPAATVRGRAVRGRGMPHERNGEWQPDAEVLEFQLVEE